MDDKELFELAKLGEEEVAVTIEQRFFKDIGLEYSETERAEGPVIYWVYQNWCMDNNLPFLTRYKFFKQLQKVITKHYSDAGVVRYWCKKEPFIISSEERFMMYKAHRDEVDSKLKQRRHEKSKAKKKQSKTSGIKESI